MIYINQNLLPSASLETIYIYRKPECIFRILSIMTQIYSHKTAVSAYKKNKWILNCSHVAQTRRNSHPRKRSVMTWIEWILNSIHKIWINMNPSCSYILQVSNVYLPYFTRSDGENPDLNLENETPRQNFQPPILRRPTAHSLTGWPKKPGPHMTTTYSRLLLAITKHPLHSSRVLLSRASRGPKGERRGRRSRGAKIRSIEHSRTKRSQDADTRHVECSRIKIGQWKPSGTLTSQAN
jgi:hypothetical protein